MDQEQLQLPAVLGRYLLLKLLARGGMGEVFLAKTGDVQGFERLFVIKKILPSLARDEQFRSRFVEEAKIAIKLNHINIAHVFEVGMVGQDLFLALEYLEGRDVRRILSTCHRFGITIPQDLALFMAREMCNGIAYAHRRVDEEGTPLHLVHCDISPPNVLVSFEGEVKVIDFGVARSAIGAHESEPVTGFGKLGYMAPEQLLKGRTVDQRTDIYSAGVVLYEMLVGDRMLDLDPEADHRTNVRKIVLDPVQPPSQRVTGLDPRLDAVIAKAIAKNPDDRFQRTSELRDEIQRVLADLNPTISADDVAAFLRELFAEELQEDRKLLLDARTTDIERYRDELDGAMEATVSYAVTTLWEGAEAPTGSADDRPPAPPAPSLGNDGLLPALAQPSVVGELGQTTPAMAPSMLAMPKRRSPWLFVILAVFGVLAGVGIVLAVVLHGGRSSRGSGETAKPVVHAEADAGLRRSGAVADGRDAQMPRVMKPRRGVARRVSTRPRPTRPRRGRATARHRPQPRTRKHPTRVVPARPAVDHEAQLAAAVQRKFRRVSSQYRRFRQMYGRRLENQWQSILHAAVYRGASKYKRLDAMLDRFRVKMAAIRRGEGH
ncbi:MAG: serine/threonine protein kinase [Deltaproteobacteria bacterium]|nr:serine/threonine protein kinase [Deltaproteobacteria bacterium]